MDKLTLNGFNQILNEESDLTFFVDGNTYCLDLTHISNDGHQIRETKFRDKSFDSLVSQIESCLSGGKAARTDGKIAENLPAIDWLLQKGFLVKLNSAYGITFITVNSKGQTEFDAPIYEHRIDEKPTFQKAFEPCNKWASDLILQIDPEFELESQKSAN